MKKLSPLFGMLVLLALSYLLDRLIEGARSVAVARISVTGYQWLVLAANLLFAACVLALGWLLLQHREAGRWQAWVLLVVGVVVILLPTPPFWTFGANFSGPLFVLLQASPHSFFSEAAAFLAVMGLATLAFGVSGGRTRALE